jgi:hypothetical protein
LFGRHAALVSCFQSTRCLRLGNSLTSDKGVNHSVACKLLVLVEVSVGFGRYQFDCLNCTAFTMKSSFGSHRDSLLSL